jgi:hypothetical protein
VKVARIHTQRIFERVLRVTVDRAVIASTPDDSAAELLALGRSSVGLRVGFTVDKDLKKTPNTAEIAIYNLAAHSRNLLQGRKAVRVVLEAGYRQTGLNVLFDGEMRAAFSRREADGTWITILRAGDADDALRSARSTASVRPGVSLDRYIAEKLAGLQIGVGNAVTEVKRQLKEGKPNAAKLGEALASGVTSAGSAGKQLDNLLASGGLEYSVQDGELQVLEQGKGLRLDAVVLSAETGLEGTPERDEKGLLHVRARLVPGLLPGRLVQVTRRVGLERHYHEIGVELDPAVYRIESGHYVGDLWGQDFTAELDCREVATNKPAAQVINPAVKALVAP